MFTSEFLCPPQHQCDSVDGILSTWGWIRDAATTQCRYGWPRHDGGKQRDGERLLGPACASQRRDWTERDSGYIRNANIRPRNGQFETPVLGRNQKPYEEKRHD